MTSNELRKTSVVSEEACTCGHQQAEVGTGAKARELSVCDIWGPRKQNPSARGWGKTRATGSDALRSLEEPGREMET